MRGCVVTDAGVVAYYLCATDWTKKEDGATDSDLTGTDGQVMVEIPKFWYRYGYSGTTHTYEVSPVPLTGFKVHEAFMSDDTEKDYSMSALTKRVFMMFPQANMSVSAIKLL